MSVNPAVCIEGPLADLTAIASQIFNPVAPSILLYNGGSCTASEAFPRYYFPSNCPNDSVPLASDNCLRIISDVDYNPLSGPAIPVNFVNVLPGGSDNKGNPANNIFSDPNSRLYSFYCPPGYEMVFYHLNPMTTTRDLAAAGGYLKATGDTLIVDACLEDIRLSNGQRFLNYSTGSDVNCKLAYCACGLPDTFPVGSYCDVSQQSVACPGTTCNAPYFIIIQREAFPNIIREMCANNRQVNIGSSENSLNHVWKPAAAGCDNFITSLCNMSDVKDSDYANLCSCFLQQETLNEQYGESLQVPVTCFGQSPDGNINKSCAFNVDAYKTNTMLQNTCSFAECETIVSESPDMRNLSSPPGSIYCDGNIVQFPVSAPTITVLPSVIITDSISIPFYVWILLGIAVFLLVLFVIILSFV